MATDLAGLHDVKDDLKATWNNPRDSIGKAFIFNLRPISFHFVALPILQA